MCGIAGIINTPDEGEEKNFLDGLCGAMAHRGPDGYGFFSEPGVLLGHRRLAVIDLKSGDQPLYSEDRKVVLVVNGEIYNYLSLRKELEEKGHVFATASDSEVILHLYEEEGTSCVSRLEGMFAFALWDGRRKVCFMGRDRMGKKPLCYFRYGNTLVFASELGALRCHPKFPETLDCDALSFYFSLQYVPADRSVFREVFKLPPAHTLLFEPETGRLTLRPYWKIDFSRRTAGSREELARELRRLLEKAVEKRLMSDVPMGVFLSGGIDSNIIAGVTAGLLKNTPCNAYTVGFEESAYDERALARKGAAHLRAVTGGNLCFHEREVKTSDFALVEELVRHCGEPYADSSILPTALLSAFAREEITVALSGDGADELFGGYERYLAMTFAAKMDKLPRSLRRLGAKAAGLLPAGGERTFSGRLRRFLNVCCGEPETRYFTLLDRCPPELKKRLFTPEFQRLITAPGAALFQAAAGPLTAAGPVEKLSETDILTYLPGDILPKVDISSMAFSLEVRSPFLDREVTEFAATLPWELKLDGRERKSLLKYAFRDLLAPEILSAPKRGFGVPVADLLRNKWALPAQEVIFDGPLKDGEFLNFAEIGRLWQEHRSRRADRSYILWTILVFALFLARGPASRL